jgi:hypothetical protein
LDVCRSLLAVFFAANLSAADPVADRVARKIDINESGKAKPGSVYVFTTAELNAWARAKVPTVVPKGVRQPRLELGTNRATGYALVDFLKVRQGSGEETNWLVSKLIQGEKPVKVIARIQSAKGRATVYLERVEIGGLAVSGSTLDFMIHNFFTPLYPNAKIDEEFELADKIDHIEVTPAEARVYIRK